MSTHPDLLANNQRWAADKLAADGRFFSRLSGVQTPEFLWLGCSDSRVSAEVITGLQPGEMFVHRNIANTIPDNDANSHSVIQYAVAELKVKHVIVCGHYGCGGVKAAMGGDLPEPLDSWIDNLRAVRDRHSEELQGLGDDDARWKRLCELHAMAQAENVCALPVIQAAWESGQPLSVHAWIYDLEDGRLHDLNVSRSG